MRISMIAVLNHLNINTDFTRIKYSGINLEKDLTKVSGFGDQTMRDMLGIVSYQEMKMNHGFYWNIPFEPGIDIHNSSNMEVLFFKGIVQQFLMAMWIISDNAINANVIVSRSTSGYIMKNYSPMLFSNASGEYKISISSREDIQNSIEWFHILLDINSKSHSEGLTLGKDNQSHSHNNSDKFIRYDEYNRVQRFLRFISLARSESFIHSKITFYISALETLLTTSQIELRMQVADRAARILGEDYEQKIKINKIVSVAYAFRSAYIHGSVKSNKSTSKGLKPFDSVEELSNELDEVIRQLTRKFLKELRHVGEMSDDDFAKWVNRLLYD